MTRRKSFAQKSSTTLTFSTLCRNILCLLAGFSIGVYSTCLWLNSRSFLSNPIATEQALAASWTQEEGAATFNSSTDIVEYLYNTTRILCWVMTNPANHLTKAIHIRHTWGRRCNKLLFMSSQLDEELQTIALPVEEGRQHLWDKTKLALKYIYDHHLDDADWFLKADDDTYVIMENLRSFLYQYPAEAPLYFGCKLNQFIQQGYMSGGAGYVLSKNALEKFATKAYNNNQLCDRYFVAEDLQLGMCLENIGVIAGDSRDVDGMERFVPLIPADVIPNQRSEWYSELVYHSTGENVTCCSPQAISFHYLTPDEFYVMEYLLYSLRPFGIFNNLTSILPPKLNVSQIYTSTLDSEYNILQLSSVPPMP